MSFNVLYFPLWLEFFWFLVFGAMKIVEGGGGGVCISVECASEGEGQGGKGRSCVFSMFVD